MNNVTLRLVLIEKHGDDPPEMDLGEALAVHLEPARPIIIGRVADVDVLVNAPSVGRHAVRLSLEPDGIRIEDLGSGGGSSLESGGSRTVRPRRRVEDPAQLQGAVLRIGRVAFRIELAPGGNAP